MSESKGRKRSRSDFASASVGTRWASMARKLLSRGPKAKRARRRQGLEKGWETILRIPTLGCLPPRCRVKMGYADSFVMGTGAAGVTGAIRNYRLNSVWDPDYTGTGVTCTGYSTFATIYGRYFVHGSQVEVTAEIRDSNTAATTALNQMFGCTVSDGVPATPVANFDTELKLERYKLLYLPRGTTAGGIYRFHHNKMARNTAGTGISSASGSLNRWVKNATGPTAYYFKDNRRYHLHDPLATLGTGGFIEHEGSGELPLTSAVGAVPDDSMFLGIWAFSLPDTTATLTASALPMPWTYVQVQLILDVEWYAPTGVAVQQAAEAGAQESDDAANPTATE